MSTFTFTVQNKVISFTAVQPQPVSITAGGSRISFTVNTGTVNIIAGSFRNYTHTLSQTDIDNKFVTISELAVVSDKTKTMVFIDNSSVHLEYGVDHTITSENKILWDGYFLDGLLRVGDKLKIYY